MEQHDFLQGSPDWHQHRATHFNASDAPAMLGISQYKSRNQLLREMATGITPEVDEATQRRFDAGHRFEALARPLAEQIIGKKLYPVIGSEGKLSASFDGLTADDSTAFEHKTLNNSLRDAISAGEIPEQYRAQMEQQLMLSGAGHCLFMASSWNDADELTEERHQWYESDHDMRNRLLQGWTQFAIDLENYVHIEHAEKPEATPVIGLPALFAQVEGEFNLSTNIVSFASELKAFVGRMDLSPTDDQGFADLEAQVKVCAQAEDSIKAQVLGARGQMVSFDEFCKTADLLLAIASRARIDGTNAIKDKKVAIKAKAIADAKALFAAHVAGLEVEIAPIRLIVEQPDFIAATKGLKGLKSLHNEIDTALANGKISADAVAKDIRAKLKWHESNFAYRFLFNDIAQIITKPFDDFTLTVKSRISDHQQAEAAKEEAQRVAIQAAATAKAEREAAEKLAEAEAKLRAAQAEEDALVDSIWKQARRVEGDSVQYVNKAIVQFETVAKAWESDPRPRVASAIADARQQLSEKLRAADERAKAEADAAAKLESDRAAMQAEEEAKAKAAQDALLAAERAKMEAEVRAKAEEEAKQAQSEAAAIEERRKQAQIADQIKPVRLSGAKTVVAQAITSRRPNRAELLDAIATTFGTTNEAALEWILQEFRGDIQHEERKAA